MEKEEYSKESDQKSGKEGEKAMINGKLRKKDGDKKKVDRKESN